MNTHRKVDAGAGISASGREEALSALVDGEDDLQAADLDAADVRERWDTYHLIGDVMRSEDLALRPSARLLARVAAAVDAQPPIVAPARLPRRHLLRLSLSGVAVAAAVASVVWIARPAMLGGEAATTGAPQVAAANEQVDQADPRLADYMAAHQAMAGAGPVRQVSFDGMGSN